MKTTKRILLVALLAGMCGFGYAQDYLNPPKSGEKVLGIVFSDPNNKYRAQGGWSKAEMYMELLKLAKQEYPNRDIDIRELTCEWYDYDTGYHNYEGPTICSTKATGKVVYTPNPETQTYESLSQALNKALRNVREDSRMAIDQVTVISSMDKGEFKDQLIDVLLDKGYKVVAKEYLEKLYEELQAQQSGIYNEKTTVKEDNFSAVGYYINVKVTETSLRVQVVNVSTGEYEGNATVNF